MNHPAESALAGLIDKNCRGFGIGVAGMDDERQTGLARRRGMRAEDLDLAFARTVLVIEIEPAFADADDLLVARQGAQGRRIGGAFARGLVGMDADRAPDIVLCLRQSLHLTEFTDLR